MFRLCLHTVDPSLGRLDYDSLSDQALMEMLVTHIEDDDIDDIKDANGNFKDACDWKYVECVDGRVTVIDFDGRLFEPDEQFPFEFIPSCVEEISMEACYLEGTVNTWMLPRGMCDGLFLNANDLDGSLDFQGFPRKLKYLFLEENMFCGSCTFADLPPTLIEFSVETNQFSGEIVIDDLPFALTKVSVKNNKLTGSIVIKKLPLELEVLFLAQNSLSGEFQLFVFPPHLRVIDISSTKMSAKAVLHNATAPMRFTLWHDCITRVVDESGGNHIWERKIKERIVGTADGLLW